MRHCVTVALLLAVGCGEGTRSTSTRATAGGDDGTGGQAHPATCPESPTTKRWDLPAAPFTVDPGSEKLGVAPVQMTNDSPVAVRRIDWASTPGLHHATVNAPIPNVAFAPPIFGVNTLAPNMSRTLPCGYGLMLNPQQMIFASYHYVNPSPSPLTANIALTFFTEEPATLISTSMMMLVITDFALPAQAAFERETVCTVPDDVTLLSLTSHEHARGKGVDIYVVGGEQDGRLAYSTSEWDNPPWNDLNPPLELKKGQGLRVVCKWVNDTDKQIAFGMLSTDEMCAAIGYYATSRDPLIGMSSNGAECTTKYLLPP